MPLSERQKVYAAMDKANGIKSRKKPPTLGQLKKKAWKLCSEYVRRKSADGGGNVRCYTCPTVSHWKKMHAGHLIPGRGHSILFDLRGLRPQCYVCNIHRQGQSVAFLIHLEQEIGVEDARRHRDELHEKAKKPYQYSRVELEELMAWLERQLLRMFA